MKHIKKSRYIRGTLRDTSGLILLGLTFLLASGLWLYGEVHLAKAVEPVSPAAINVVTHAVPAEVEGVGEVTVQSPPTLTPKQEILQYIVTTFGDDADKMITIIGTCENGTWDQTRTNTNRNGTKDWGLAQINDANSKLCKGLDYQYDWKDNLECAHRVYKSQGLSAWACSHKVGITPFHLKGKE